MSKMLTMERKLHLERHHLLDLKFAGTISPEQEVRLAEVRAELDRLAMLRHGPAFDALERSIRSAVSR